MIWLVLGGPVLSLLLALLGAREFSTAARERQLAVTGAEPMGEADRPRGIDRVDRWFRRTDLGRRIERQLEFGGIQTRPSVVVIGGLALGCLFVFLLWTFLAPLLGVVGFLLSFLAVRAFLRRAQERRREAFVGQLPELARVLANASYAGLAMPTAIAIAGDELSEPAHTELSRVAMRLRFGASLSSALAELQERVGSRETSVLISTLVVASRSGGSLVTALRDIATTLDQRKETRREIRTTLAQPIATTYLVMIIGVLMLVMLNVMRPGTVDLMTRKPLGQAALLMAFGIFSGGSYVLRRMTRIDV